MKQTSSKVNEFIETTKSQIQDLFDENRLTEQAKQTEFILRSTNRIVAIDFVQLMSLEILSEKMISNEGLCDILAALNPNSQISPQALQQRLARDGAANFLATVFDDALTHSLACVFDQIPPQLLAPFGRVLLQDSTVVKLNQKLADSFAGTGGSASRATLKLSLIYEHLKQQIHHVQLTQGKTSESQVGENLLMRLCGGDLVIRDLGYWSIDALQTIDKNGAFFLNRLQPGTGIYLTDKPTATPIEIAEYLDKFFADQPVIDIDVYLGKERLSVRLIAYRAPQQVINQRLRRAKNLARKKGRKPSRAHLRWLTFSFYVTNVPVEIFCPQVVGTIYRLRWQIELLFKQWNSLLQIDCLTGTQVNRILSFVYGRLIAVVLVSMSYRCLCCYAFTLEGQEPSLTKLTNWLLRRGRLADAVQQGKLGAMFSAMLQVADKQLLKQKRFRKTTTQLIDQQIAFVHSFS